MRGSTIMLTVACVVAVGHAACSTYGDATNDIGSNADGGAGEDAGGLGDGGGLPDGAPPDGAPAQRNDFADPVLDPGTPVTAVQAAQIFALSNSAAAGPCLAEPQIGSLIPKNWMPLRFRVAATQGENLFEIRLVIPNQKSPLVIYTNKDTFKLDAATWTTILTHSVGTIDVSVRSATLDAGGNRTDGPFRGSQGQIEIAPIAAHGKVSYFSSSDGSVKRFGVGDLNVQAGSTSVDANGTCIGCHSVTPDGLHAALTLNGGLGGIILRPVGGGTTEPAFLTASARTLLARNNQHAASFSKAHWAAGDRTMLSMLDVGGTTEIIWTDLEAGSAAGWGIIARDGDVRGAQSAVMSHDGTKIAYVSATATSSGTISNNGAIHVVPYNARQGGAATALVADGSVNYYPSFSADDAFVAFAKAPGGTSTYNNASAEIWVVPAAGGLPVRLAANDAVACLSTPSPGITNSWPRWSPAVITAGTKKYYFLTFSSTRIGATRQVFVAPLVVEGGTLKSYPALYPHNQPETSANHTPQWSEPL
ncbi:MAG: hypothetical protein KF819_30345 [Labilithrix sp.]|nr:hypothetical protein [Labilithrix sp.]